MILTVFSGFESTYTVITVKISGETYLFMLSPDILSTIKITGFFSYYKNFNAFDKIYPIC